MDVSKFNEKLNKVDGNIYVIEEVITPINGVYEAELIHDNVNLTTLNVYTGSKLAGDKVNTYTTSTPSLTPWKTVIKIFSTISPLYVSYETSGDTVEAEDINKLQNAVIATQENLNSEINRATNRENQIENDLNSEISRAKVSENTITTNLNNEIARAKNAEGTLTTNLTNEVNRATAAESTLTNNLTTETNRAKSAESTLITNLNSEITRATNAENTLTNNLNSESTRAKEAESTITNTINTNKPIWDDKYTKNEIDNKLSVLVTNLDWKESVATISSLATTYPTPDDGWTVNVKDTDITYRYDGIAWIPISANSIPLATSSVDGKMSKQDKIDHDDMTSKKHTHANKSIIDIITQALVDNWNAAYTHISDTIKHITLTERTNWNSAYTHISDAVKHITSSERSLWNTVSNKVDKVAGKQLSTNDFDNNYKSKIDNIEVVEAGDYVNYLSISKVKIELNNLGYVRVFRKIILCKGAIRLKLDIQDSGSSTSHIQIYINDNSVAEYSTGSTTQSISIDLSVNGNDVLEIGGYSEAGVCNISNIKICTNKNIPYFGNSNGGTVGTVVQSAEEIGAMSKIIYDTDGDGIVDNSDKLDGKHASDFAPAGFGLGGNGKRLATSTDLNTIIANGWYDVQTPVNGPYASGWFNFIVMCSGDANYLTQLGFGMTVNIGHTYIRTRNAGNWSAWTELYSTSVKPTPSDIGASSSTHNHDTSYMKKGPVTWNDLEGV